VRREYPSLSRLEIFGFGGSTTATSRKQLVPLPKLLVGVGKNSAKSYFPSCRHLHHHHHREFHTSAAARRMSNILSPTSLTPLPLGSSKSPMSSSLNLTGGEGDDDIGALSAGFDRRRTLRRRLSTAFDPGESDSAKTVDKLITLTKHRESINEDEELPVEAMEKPKDLKVQDVLGQLENVISYRGRHVSHIIVEVSGNVN